MEAIRLGRTIGLIWFARLALSANHRIRNGVDVAPISFPPPQLLGRSGLMSLVALLYSEFSIQKRS
jgi:hypothetical protein